MYDGSQARSSTSISSMIEFYQVKFIYSEKATIFYEISIVDLSFVVKFGFYEKAIKVYLANVRSNGRLFQNLWPS